MQVQEIVPGVSQWQEMGKKLGYWDYFKKEARRELAAEMLAEMEQTITDKAGNTASEEKIAAREFTDDIVKYAGSRTHIDPGIGSGTGYIGGMPFNLMNAYGNGNGGGSALRPGAVNVSINYLESEAMTIDNMLKELARRLYDDGMVAVRKDPAPTNSGTEIKMELQVLPPTKWDKYYGKSN